MKDIELYNKNRTFLRKAVFKLAVSPFQLVETIERAHEKKELSKYHNLKDYELIERDDSLQKNPQLGHLFVHSDDSDILIDFMKPIPRINTLLKKVEFVNPLRDDYSLIEIPFTDLGYKIGIDICGYTITGEDHKFTESPLKLLSGTKLEHLAVLYGAELNSEVPFEKHRNLLNAYLDNSIEKLGSKDITIIDDEISLSGNIEKTLTYRF